MKIVNSRLFACASRCRQFELLAREIVDGAVDGIHASSHHGFSLEFTDRRNYAPGDDPRQIDYKAFARTDRLEIKRFESESNRQTFLLLDASGSMSCRFSSNRTVATDAQRLENLSKFEYGCFLTAIIAFFVTRQCDPVGLTIFDSKIQTIVEPKCSFEHFQYITQRLEQFDPHPGESTNLDGVLDFYGQRLKKRSLIILISDLYCDSDAVVRRLKALRKKHEILVFHLFDHEELTFPFDRCCIFQDEETGEHFSVEPRRVRKAYFEELHRFIENYRKNCFDCGIEYYQVDTSVAFDQIFCDFLAGSVNRDHRSRLV